MTKKEFDKLAESLYAKDYKKYNQQWHHEDYVIGKGFHKADNQWEECRYAYQIILSIYDYTEKKDLWDRLPKCMQNHVGIEIHIDVSRTINERVDLTMAWHDDTTIEEVESQAETFYQFVCSTWPKPREELKQM